MNPCEAHIRWTFIAADVAEVFWDADEYYLKDKNRKLEVFTRISTVAGIDNREFNWFAQSWKNQKT